MTEKLIKLTLVIALLINSAGQGYALRPMAVRSSEADSPDIEELFKVVIKDKSGIIIDRCSPKRLLPKRVLRLINRSSVGSITNIFVSEGDFLILSPQLCYDFRRLGPSAGRSIIAHFNGKNKPSHFTIFDKTARPTEIDAEDLRIAPHTFAKEITLRLGFEKVNKRGAVIRDAMQIEPSILPAERNKINDLLSTAAQQLPADKRHMATILLNNLAWFINPDGRIDMARLTEYLSVGDAEIQEVMQLLVETDNLKKLALAYNLQTVLTMRAKSNIKARLSGPVLPDLPKGYVYIRDLSTGDIETISKRELCNRYRSRYLDNVEVIYDRLDPRGGLNMGRRKTICMFTGYPEKRVRYIIRNGKADRTTIIILNDKDEPLYDDKIRYAIDPRTGEILFHLPFEIRSELQKELRRLDDIIFYGRLSSQKGEFCFRQDGKSVFTCISHAGGRIKCHICRGEPDPLTVILLNEEGRPILDGSIRYAADPESDDIDNILFHLPTHINRAYMKKLRKKEELIIYDRLDNAGHLCRRRFTRGRQKEICLFSNRPNQRLKYHIRKGVADQSTTLLLNEDRTILEDRFIKYTQDPESGKMLSHLPDSVSTSLLKKIYGRRIYDRTDKSTGKVALLRRISGHPYIFRGHKFGRLSYIAERGGVGEIEPKLLREDGSVKDDGEERYITSPNSDEIRFHLPDNAWGSLISELGTGPYEINDRLDNQGWLSLGVDRSGRLIRHYQYLLHPGRRVRYGFLRDRVDLNTVVLLNEDCTPLDDGVTRYAIDQETGTLAYHLRKGLSRERSSALGNVTIMNDRLTKQGRLYLAWNLIYCSSQHPKGRVIYRINSNRVISVVLLDEDFGILREEILDEGSLRELSPKKSDIDFIKTPQGYHIVTYSEFLNRLYNDYLELSAKSTGRRLLNAIFQKRLNDLLEPNVYFFLGEELREEAQLKIKTEILLLWRYLLDNYNNDGVRKRLLKITQLFAEYARENIGDEPRAASRLPRRFLEEIDLSRERMVRAGMLHARQIDLPDAEKINRASVLQSIDASA